MKTRLLYVGAALFLISCDHNSNTEIPQNLPIDKMKERVEAEEILFDIEEVMIDVEDGMIETLDNIEPERTKELLGNGDPFRDNYEEPVLVREPRPSPPDFYSPVRVGNLDDSIVDFPEVDAQFPGGMAEFQKFMRENLRYPDCEFNDRVKIYVSMIIGTKGEVRDAKVMRVGIAEFNEEALRVVNLMPNWISAEHNGKIVATKVRLPITFDLN